MKTKKPNQAAADAVIGARIGQIADLLENRKKAADVAGLSTDQLQRYIKGLSQPTLAPVARLCEATGARLEWVWTGIGAMRAAAAPPPGFAAPPNPPPDDREAPLPPLSACEQALVAAYRQLPPPQRDLADTLLPAWLAQEADLLTRYRRLPPDGRRLVQTFTALCETLTPTTSPPRPTGPPALRLTARPREFIDAPPDPDGDDLSLREQALVAAYRQLPPRQRTLADRFLPALALNEAALISHYRRLSLDARSLVQVFACLCEAPTAPPSAPDGPPPLRVTVRPTEFDDCHDPDDSPASE